MYRRSRKINASYFCDSRLAARLRRIEKRDSGLPPSRLLPHVVEPGQLESDEARRLRQQGYVVVTFEQCVELMV
jgi:hypothetical protein